MAESMNIYRITDQEFIRYGRPITIPVADIEETIATTETLVMPEIGTCYEPSISILEKQDRIKFFRDEFFGELPIQIGCCWGHNDRVNALEWHASSEINIAVTDFILMLGRIDEMKNNTFNTSDLKAFLIRKGEAVEIYSMTLHFCPCTENINGFRCIVILPYQTNCLLENRSSSRFLFRKNKWLICHVDNEVLKAKGVYPGLSGENFTICK
ncbi:MAG: DUF4867 family protein [Planctomycetaceae bacterium]|jgi:hypothetical protein|nr:DUF4867 family protein [Planctomycetaceae bacterium]